MRLETVRCDNEGCGNLVEQDLRVFYKDDPEREWVELTYKPKGGELKHKEFCCKECLFMFVKNRMEETS